MKTLLLTALFLLLAHPSLAVAGSLRARGQTFVFGIFCAPPPAQMTWLEADGVTKLANGYVSGANPVNTSSDGKFAFNLGLTMSIIRSGTYIQGQAIYLGGVFYVTGQSTTIRVFTGPSQDTIINGLVVNMY